MKQLVIAFLAIIPLIAHSQTAQDSTLLKQLADSAYNYMFVSMDPKFTGGEAQVIYQMIKADTFTQEFIQALQQLSSKVDQHPVYEALWKAKL